MKKLKVLEGNKVKVFGHEFELEFPKLNEEEIYEKVVQGMNEEFNNPTELKEEKPKKKKK